MRRIFLISALPLLLGACASTELDGCEGLGWPKAVTVAYGEDGITVTPKRKVRRKSSFAIRLKPRSKEFKDKVVTIQGDSVEPGGDGVPNPSWLNTSDDYNTRKSFRYCTPELPGDKDQEYKYTVKVEGLGEIDPRVDVTF